MSISTTFHEKIRLYRQSIWAVSEGASHEYRPLKKASAIILCYQKKNILDLHRTMTDLYDYDCCCTRNIECFHHLRLGEYRCNYHIIIPLEKKYLYNILIFNMNV